MRNIVEQYSPTNNFWEVNPQFTTLEPYRRIWMSDKSRGKKCTSDIMWTIALCYHPKSDLYYVPDKETKLAMSVADISKKEVDKFWEDNKVFVEAFKEIIPQSQRSLISWEARMKQRDKFLAEQEYHFEYVDDKGFTWKDNTKALDDMNSKTGKFYDELFKIQKDIEEEEIKSTNGKKGYSSSDISI